MVATQLRVATTIGLFFAIYPLRSLRRRRSFRRFRRRSRFHDCSSLSFCATGLAVLLSAESSAESIDRRLRCSVRGRSIGNRSFRFNRRFRRGRRLKERPEVDHTIRIRRCNRRLCRFRRKFRRRSSNFGLRVRCWLRNLHHFRRKRGENLCRCKSGEGRSLRYRSADCNRGSIARLADRGKIVENVEGEDDRILSSVRRVECLTPSELHDIAGNEGLEVQESISDTLPLLPIMRLDEVDARSESRLLTRRNRSHEPTNRGRCENILDTLRRSRKNRNLGNLSHDDELL